MNTSRKDPPNNRVPKKTPAWLLERHAHGELSNSQVDELRARLAAEGRSLEEEITALALSDQEILSQVPKEGAVAAIRARAAAGPRRRRWLNLWVAPLALAGSLGIGLLLLRSGHAPSPVARSTSEGEWVGQSTSEGESTRIKGERVLGGARLLVYRQRGVAANDSQPERLADGARAARGDLLQLAYKMALDGAYGVLVSIDGAGRVTQHLPEPGARSAAPLRSEGEVRLASAYELDDAPAFERFLLISTSEPFPVAVAVDAARSLAVQGPRARTAPLALAPAFHQTSVLLQKTSKGTP
jgi:hypothetical protein